MMGLGRSEDEYSRLGRCDEINARYWIGAWLCLLRSSSVVGVQGRDI